MPITESLRSWYALYTRSRFENVVFQGLCKKSMEAFLPRIRVKSRRRDRTLMIQIPLFPGYLFVRTDLNPKEYIDILRTVGVVRMMGGKGGPVPVADSVIASLKIMTLPKARLFPVIACSEREIGLWSLTGLLPYAVWRIFGVQERNVAREYLKPGQSAIVDVSAQDVEMVPPDFVQSGAILFELKSDLEFCRKAVED